jgi:hypothetical protein
MTKNQFVALLRHFVYKRGVGIPDEYGHSDTIVTRGTLPVIQAFADWYDKNPNTSELFGHLKYHLEDAYNEFRTLPEYASLRKAYSNETGGRTIVSLTDSRGGSQRASQVHDVLRVLSIVTGFNWLREDLSSYFNAQFSTIEQAWRGFVRKTHPDLIRRVNASDLREHEGTFGTVTVSTYVIAGRVGVSFERGNHSVAAVCDAGDESGIRSGLDHCQCFFTEAVSIIREATESWDLRNLIGKNSSCS